MGTEIDYIAFWEELDKKLEDYFQAQSEYICCKRGCSYCCETGDYPVTEIELRYLMKGFLSLETSKKILVQQNFKQMQKGKKCPFLINSECSIYAYRPVICRVHGLAYLCNDNIVKLPYCVHIGKNFSKIYKNGEICINPIDECLDTLSLLKDLKHGESRPLYEWICK